MTVRVVDASGRPVADAQTRLVHGWWSDWREEATDEHGRCAWTASDVPERARVVRAVARTDDGRVALSPWTALPGGAPLDLGEVVLVAPESLRSQDDRDAAGWFGRESPPGRPVRGPAPPPPGASGSLAVAGTVLLEGREVTWEEHPTSSAWPRLSGCLVEIRATSVDGLSQAVARTQKDGTFRIEGLEEQDHDLAVSVLTGGEPWPADALLRGVRPPVEGLRVELSRAVRQSVELVLPEGAGADVRAVLAWAPSDGGPDGGRSTGTGRPDVLRLRPDVRYSLYARAYADGRRFAAARVASFFPSPFPLRVEIPPGLGVEGVVVRADGRPLVGALVSADSDEQEGLTAAADWTDLDGRFRLSGFDAGDVAVEVRTTALLARATVAAGTADARIVVPETPR